jgi:SAM-dependent methyltransferase
VNLPELGQVGVSANGPRSFWRQVDGFVGRGSYHRVRRWLDPEWRYPHFVYAETVDELLKPGMRWLDAGCGHQAFEFRLSEQEKAAVARAACAAGCDAYLPALRTHRSLNKLVCCTLAALPFAPSTFDLVTLNMVAEHLSSPEVVFAGLVRILAPNGLLVVYTPNASGYETLLSRIGSSLLPRKWTHGIIRFLEHRESQDVFPTFYRANTCRRLRELLGASGLAQERISLLNGRPLLYFFAPLCALEILLNKVLRACGLREFVGGTILAVYRNSGRPQ